MAAAAAAFGAFGAFGRPHEGSGQPIREQRGSSSSSSSSSSDASSGAAAAAPVRPLAVDTSAKPQEEPTTPTPSVKDIVEKTETQMIAVAGRQREPKFFAVARGIMRTTLSPRSRAASADATSSSSSAALPNTTTSTTTSTTTNATDAAINSSTSAAKSTRTMALAVTGFGKFRRANTSVKEPSKQATPATPATPAIPTVAEPLSVQAARQQTAESKPKLQLQTSSRQPTQQQQQQHRLSFRAGIDNAAGTRVDSATRQPSTKDDHRDAAAAPAASAGGDTGESALQPQEKAAGHDFVDEVRKTLDQLVAQLDGVDPKKLYAIRLGGELRGLLGKAQDEFGAYEDAFLEHASQVGVSIALQNFSASLLQVFEIVARLQSAKALFLLNKKFKREVLFAFQEINSYYTSLFMELAMAVAKRSGIVLPLPSPVKPQPPELVVEEPPVVVVETPPPPPSPPKAPTPAPPSAEMLCLEAHQHFYGHRRPRDPARALALYTHAAELGSAEARACLGDMFFDGVGVEKDLLVAEKWLSEAASAGSLDACHSLGRLLCERAQHQTRNEVKQRELYSLAMIRFAYAAENGHSGAQFELGVLHERGIVNARDPEQAMLWLKRAASQGHTAAEASLGRILFQGEFVERDLTQAIHFLQRAAAKNDASSQRMLGSVFARGDGAKVDLERAIAFFRKAVEGGDSRAMLELAQLLLAQTSADNSPASVRFGDREEIHDEALRLLLNAGAGGVLDAFASVGELLESSRFLRDKAAALRFYSKAATATPSHPKAAKRAAAMYYSGIGTVADKWKAHRLYSIAADAGDAGDAEALNALGLMFEEGEGCDLDFKSAGECYRRAVELGDPHAHFNLGCLLSSGKGVPRNVDAAQAHFRKALELGYALARDFLKPPT